MNSEKFTVPAATFAEKPDGYELKVTLPGIGKEDAELHVEGRTLTLKARTKHQNPAGFKQVAAEFDYADYAMSVDLPEMANPSALSARLENGILVVTVEKKPETRAKRIEIS